MKTEWPVKPKLVRCPDCDQPAPVDAWGRWFRSHPDRSGQTCAGWFRFTPKETQ